jgi:hypothetical protein
VTTLLVALQSASCWHKWRPYAEKQNGPDRQQFGCETVFGGLLVRERSKTLRPFQFSENEIWGEVG